MSRLIKIRVLTAFSICIFLGKHSPAQSTSPQGSIITSEAVVLDPAIHKAYVVDTQHDCLSEIDTAKHREASISVGKAPISIALNPLTHRVYIANHGSGTVSVVDGESGRVVTTIPVDKLPYSIAVDQRTNQIFVSSVYSNNLKIIDGSNNSVTSMKAISADAISVNAGAGIVYLMSYESSEITTLNIASGTLNKLPVGTMHVWALARNPVTSMLYITRIGSADVFAYNEKLHTSSIIRTGNYPCAIAINTKTNRIYVVNYADQTVTVVDGKENHILTTLPVGNHPQAIAVDEGANRAYVANVLDDSITVIDGAKNAIADTLQVGKNPFGVVIDQKTGAIITANQGNPSFTLIDRSILHSSEHPNAMTSRFGRRQLLLHHAILKSRWQPAAIALDHCQRQGLWH